MNLNLNQWMWYLEKEGINSIYKSLEVDYDRYGAGEGRLAWLDKQLTVEVDPGKGRMAVITLIQVLVTILHDQKIPVGHLKFFIRSEGEEVKISFPTLYEEQWEDKIPRFLNSRKIEILINGRVEGDASVFDDLVQKVILEISNHEGVKITVIETAAFHPQYPKPTHRIQ